METLFRVEQAFKRLNLHFGFSLNVFQVKMADGAVKVSFRMEPLDTDPYTVVCFTFVPQERGWLADTQAAVVVGGKPVVVPFTERRAVACLAEFYAEHDMLRIGQGYAKLVISAVHERARTMAGQLSADALKRLNQVFEAKGLESLG